MGTELPIEGHRWKRNTIEKAPKDTYYAATDPNQLATRFLKLRYRDGHGHLALRFWRDEFWRFHEGRYINLPKGELEAKASEFIREEFQRTKPAAKNGQLLQVTRNVVTNMMQALRGRTLIEGHLEQPIWLGQGHEGPYFVFGNARVNTNELLGGHRAGAIPHCSHWFSQTTFYMTTIRGDLPSLARFPR